MVRALVDGRKTQTRRIINPQPCIRPEINECSGYFEVYNGDELAGRLRMRILTGDRLYVREHWRTSGSLDKTSPRDLPQSAAILFEADGKPAPVWRGKHRQAMHMPKWASRLTLTVTDVRVERLQDISEEDAHAEGCPVTWDGKPYDPPPPEVDSWQGYGRASYCLLWSKINGPGSWDANPWVVAYTFTVHRGNIDQIARAA
jgi:hypothetical protein